MRKFTKACFVLSTVFLLLVPVVNAQENVIDENEKNSELIRIDSNLIIEKKLDGRVLPILNSNNQKLTSDQQDAILKEMRFTEDEIQSMSPSEKESTALAGGVKVDSETILLQYFNASDGKKYLVTDENRDEIEALRQQEAKKLSRKLNKEIQIQPLSSVKDGIFSARGHVTYQGKSPNATEFEYRYNDSFDWSSTPQNTITDTLAHAWQSHSTSVKSEAVTNTVVLGNNNYKYPSVIPEGVYASYFKFPYTTRFDSMNGYLVNHVRIPISEKGHTGKFVARYAHPWTLVTPGISAGPISISYGSFIGDEWYWETTYTINGLPV